jgi:SAM-dependent methyltransferase
MTSANTPNEETYHFRGYNIPVRLMKMTGAGPETWDSISANHINQYERLCPIQPHHNVLEIGCGVGRDAIPIAERLISGQFVGIDIMREHVEWCTSNISLKHRNCQFIHYDIHSPDYNPKGTFKTEDVQLTAINLTFDRILLQSAFTHMLYGEVLHYLTQFQLLLNAKGVVFATFYFLDTAKHAVAKTHSPYKFPHQIGEGVFINDANNPRRVVAYSITPLAKAARQSGLTILGIHHGYWAGSHRAPHSQDIILFTK